MVVGYYGARGRGAGEGAKQVRERKVAAGQSHRNDGKKQGEVQTRYANKISPGHLKR